MNEAIKTAINGGWRNHYFSIGAPVEDVADRHLFWREIQALILLDPSFWQALGKAWGG